MKPGGGRAKGAGFELDVAWYFSLYWWGTPRAIRRTPMSGGWSKTSAAGDLISEVQPFPLSIECKFSVAWHFGQLFTPQWSELGDYWKQCVHDASVQKTKPILVFKSNGTPIYAMLERTSVPHLEEKHGRVFTRDYRDAGVIILRLREDFLKLDLRNLYEHVMPQDIYNWDLFQKIRVKAQVDFPPTAGDLTEMAKVK